MFTLLCRTSTSTVEQDLAGVLKNSQMDACNLGFVKCIQIRICGGERTQQAKHVLCMQEARVYRLNHVILWASPDPNASLSTSESDPKHRTKSNSWALPGMTSRAKQASKCKFAEDPWEIMLYSHQKLCSKTCIRCMQEEEGCRLEEPNLSVRLQNISGRSSGDPIHAYLCMALSLVPTIEWHPLHSPQHHLVLPKHHQTKLHRKYPWHPIHYPY